MIEGGREQIKTGRLQEKTVCWHSAKLPASRKEIALEIEHGQISFNSRSPGKSDTPCAPPPGLPAKGRGNTSRATHRWSHRYGAGALDRTEMPPGRLRQYRT